VLRALGYLQFLNFKFFFFFFFPTLFLVHFLFASAAPFSLTFLFLAKTMEQDDSEGICVINYPPEFVKLMDQFRKAVHEESYTMESFELTSSLLEYNPANYSVWLFRRRLLLGHPPSQEGGVAGSFLAREMEYLDQMTEENPKNYQIWHHRQVLLAHIHPQGQQEDKAPAQAQLLFTHSIFREDSKNYHAWTFRQWVLKYFNAWEGELDYTSQLISEDLRNNSAWNHRYFVLQNGPQKLSDPSVLAQEVEYPFYFSFFFSLRFSQASFNLTGSHSP